MQAAAARPRQQHRVLTAGATTFDEGRLHLRGRFANLASLAAAADLLVVDGDLIIAAGSLLSFVDLRLPRRPSSKTRPCSR